MSYNLHPDKLIAVTKNFQKTPAKSKKSKLAKKPAPADGSLLIKNLAFQLGARNISNG